MVKKIFILSSLFLAFILFFFVIEIDTILSLEYFLNHYYEIQKFASSYLLVSSFIYISAYILMVILSIPTATILTLIGGILFGWIAFFFILISATIGATILFIIVKKSTSGYFEKKTKYFFKRFANNIKKNQLGYLISLRLIPIFPFWVVNIVPALLGMKLKTFMIGTFIGIIPGTFIYVWISISFSSVINQGSIPNISDFTKPEILFSLSALGIINLITIFINKKRS